MKNKIIATAILIASIILIGKSLTPLKIYNHINDGNSFVESEKYSKGREEYKKALSLRENKSIHNNILKSFYMEKNYEEVIKSPADENFLKGNSLVYIGDNSPEQSQEQYKKALEEYKLAMKKSDDINIKKNYELTLKKLQESSQQNQENQQENQENKDKQKDKQNQQQNDEKNSDNQEQQKNNSNSQENNQQNKDNQSSDNEQNDNKQSSDNQQQNSNQEDKQDKENNQASSNDEKNREEQKNNASQTQDSTENSNQGKEQSQEEIRKQEVRAILQRLEGSEKQSFKNNERVMDINNNNPSNRW